MFFLIRLAIINVLILLPFAYFLVENLPVPLGGQTIDNLNQMDVLSAQTSASNLDLVYQLPRHDKPSDCWVEYSGRFYDATALLDLDATLADYCGQDATQLFDSKDQSQSSLHSVDARRMLAQFQIQ